MGNITGYAYSNSVERAKAFDPLNRLTQTCVATHALPLRPAGQLLLCFHARHFRCGGERALGSWRGICLMYRELPSATYPDYRLDVGDIRRTDPGGKRLA